MPKSLRLSVIALSLCAALTLTACSAPERSDDGKPVVVTTFTVIADMAQVVGGDLVTVESITKTGAEIHGYEPTPSDLRRAQNADLILDNGFGLERWFEKFVDRLDVPHVVLTEGIDPIDIGEGDYAGRPNPHAWMSPIAGMQYVENIAAALSELHPEGASTFESNAAAYSLELAALADQLTEAVQTLPQNERILVSCEGAFSYLARDVGLTESFLWAVNSESQGTPQQVRGVIDVVESSAVRAVFCESTVSDTGMREVARATGAEFGGSLFVDSLSEPDGPVPSYLELLQYDVDLIVAGLSRD